MKKKFFVKASKEVVRDWLTLESDGEATANEVFSKFLSPVTPLFPLGSNKL